MQASDIMTKKVVTVSGAETVRRAAELMARHHVSALPVVDDKGKLVGIISEGDLMRRTETGTEKRRSWWLDLVTSAETRAEDYVKTFGTHVRDVMSTDLATVDEKATLSQIAELLESRHIKRVPVLRGGKLVGIVSRANLVQALASLPKRAVPDTKPDDAALREQVLDALDKERWAPAGSVNVVVQDGAVKLWGTVFTTAERKALKVMVERIPGVRSVEDRLIYYVPPTIMT